jgi:hypothetical protein
MARPASALTPDEGVGGTATLVPFVGAPPSATAAVPYQGPELAMICGKITVSIGVASWLMSLTLTAA